MIRAAAVAPAPVVLRGKVADSDKWLSRLMLAPAIAYIFLLVGAPFVLALFFSLTNVTVTGRHADFVGLDNFRDALQNPTFRRALGNTFIFAFGSQALVAVLASTLAIALQQELRWKWLKWTVRLLVLLPWVAPISLGTIGWLWIFEPIYSVINWTLLHLHLIDERKIWLGVPSLAKASVIAVQVWRTLPLATVILLGGLSSIPQDIHDAAEVDGAGFFRHLFQVTLPLVLPIQLVALLFGFVFAFTDMIVIYVLTRGGPYETTHVLASVAFYKGIDGGDLAGGAAIALFLFPVLAAAAIMILRLARRSEVI